MTKFAVISDTHLGQTGADGSGYYSVLSRPEAAPEDIRPLLIAKQDAFVKALADFAKDEKITLIGVGDILDLAMSHVRTALDDLVALFKKLPMVDSFIYVAGNHDIKMWGLHCEELGVIQPMRDGDMPNKGSIFEITCLNGERSILSPLLRRQLDRNFWVDIAYPVFYLNSPLGKTCFMHGHIFGDCYTLVSNVLRPYINDPNRLRGDAIVNAPLTEFIDFLIAQLGDGMGADGLAETIYADMQKGKASSVNALLDRAVDVLLPDGLIKGIPDSWERWLVKKVSKKLVDGTLPHLNQIVSADRHQDTSITRAAAKKWLTEVLVDKNVKLFVSGHTHIADDFEVDVNGSKVRCLNPGSWQAEPLIPEADTQIIFIDEDVKMVKV